MTMDVTKAIVSRRSIRKYTTEPVSDEDIEALLNAAMHAPSAVNEQPWHFVVVKDRETLAAIPQISPTAPMVKDAPVGNCGLWRQGSREVSRIVGARLLCRYGKHVACRHRTRVGGGMDSGVPLRRSSRGHKEPAQSASERHPPMCSPRRAPCRDSSSS